jgi:hypothetical protein
MGRGPQADHKQLRARDVGCITADNADHIIYTCSIELWTVCCAGQLWTFVQVQDYYGLLCRTIVDFCAGAGLLWTFVQDNCGLLCRTIVDLCAGQLWTFVQDNCGLLCRTIVDFCAGELWTVVCLPIMDCIL